MAYDYFTDIFDALWDGSENAEEPYATIIADNPTLFDEESEQRILSTIEAVRSHMELLADRDEARLFHFCLSTMLEGIGSGGFIYGATSDNELAVIEGNVVNPVFTAGDEIELWNLDGVAGLGGEIDVVAASGGDLDSIIADINGASLTDVDGAAITASRTQDSRLRLTQAVAGGATRARGFIIVRGGGARTGTNDNIVAKAGIVTQEPGARVVENGGVAADDIEGGYYLPKVIEVANNCRDRALAVFVGQIREPGLNT